MEKKYLSSEQQFFIMLSVGVLINFSVAFSVALLRLPLFLDCIGTIISSVIVGWRVGSLAGIITFGIMSLTISPLAIFFAGTQVAIAIFIDWAAKHGGFKNILMVILTGLGCAIVAAVVSSPVKVFLFGGIDGSGSSLIVAFFVASGKTIWNSVIITGLSVEPIDKTAQVLIAYTLIKSIPKSTLLRFNNKYRKLEINGFIN